MKNILLAILLITSPVTVPVLMTGCSTSQQAAGYKTLAVTQASVQTARAAFLEAAVAGKVPVETAVKARAASKAFNAAFNAAAITTKTTNAPTPQNVADAAAAFLAIVATFIN